MKKLTHTGEDGAARMVDVSAKPESLRQATAEGSIVVNTDTLHLIRENLIRKGDVLAIAEFAAISAAKKTPDLIPLCHPILISDIKAKAELTVTGVKISCTVKSTGKTGVEMEALSAVSIGLLTIYDMCKAVDKNMVIGEVRLVEKTKIDV